MMRGQRCNLHIFDSNCRFDLNSRWREISDLVKNNKFDGIDIDYESKWSSGAYHIDQ